MFERLHIWYRRFRARQKSKRREEFNEFAQMRDLAVHWTTVKCPRCYTPAASDDARYCVKCGLTLEATVTLSQPTTDLLIDERPLLAYCKAVHPYAGPATLAHRAMSHKDMEQLKKNAQALVVRSVEQ